MRRRTELPGHLRARAGARGGVLLRSETADGVTATAFASLSRSRVALGGGVWCVTAPTWTSMAWAARLRGGDGAVLGGLAAAHLHGVARDVPRQLTCWVPQRGYARDFTLGEWSVRFRRGERAGIGELPRTHLEQTLLEVAAEAGEDETVSIVTRAFVLRRTNPSRMLTALAAAPRVARRSLLAEL